MKDKVNMELVKQLIYEGYNDEEIGNRVNRSKYTIRGLRFNKLNIKKDDSLYFLREWRVVVWRKYRKNPNIDASLISIPLKYMKMLSFPVPCSRLCYKLSPKTPNQILIEFKKEEDIYDKSLIRRRTFKGRRPRSDTV